MKKLGRPKIKEYREYIKVLMNPTLYKEQLQETHRRGFKFSDQAKKMLDMMENDSWWLLPIFLIGLIGSLLWLSIGERTVQWVSETLEAIDALR